MLTGICITAYIPVRSAPDHRSEMVSQLLFGEGFDVLETRNSWLYVEMHYDQYQGWIAGNQVMMLDNQSREQLNGLTSRITTSRFAFLSNSITGEEFPISAGSTFLSGEGGKMSIGKDQFIYHGNLTGTDSKADLEQLEQYARSLLNTPYLWGGRTAFGIDCSGLVQLVFKLSGIRLPRDSKDQAKEGENIHLIHETKTGDLLFFDNEEGEINHVGMMIGEGMIIHAHGKVRIDKVDHHGIFDASHNRYTHKLRLIRRIIHD